MTRTYPDNLDEQPSYIITPESLASRSKWRSRKVQTRLEGLSWETKKEKSKAREQFCVWKIFFWRLKEHFGRYFLKELRFPLNWKFVLSKGCNKDNIIGTKGSSEFCCPDILLWKLNVVFLLKTVIIIWEVCTSFDPADNLRVIWKDVWLLYSKFLNRNEQVKHICPPNIISIVTNNKNELWKLLG